MRVSGLILAGGQGRRMNGEDKGWVSLAGKPMIEQIIDRLAPQVDDVMINANRNINRYKKFKLTVIPDQMTGYQGPLAGILSGLEQCQSPLMVCVPCDTPFFPKNLVATLLQKHTETNADIVSVSDAERAHPVFAMIKTELRFSLSEYLMAGERKIDRWYQQHHYALVDYPGSVHYFENINTTEQLKAAEMRMLNNAQ